VAGARRRVAALTSLDGLVLMAALTIGSIIVLANSGTVALLAIPGLLALVVVRLGWTGSWLAMGIISVAAFGFTADDRGPFPELERSLDVGSLVLCACFTLGLVAYVAILGMFVDHRDRSLSARKIDEDIYRIIANGSQDIVFVTNTVGSVRFVSPAVSLQLGVPEDALTSREWDRYVHPDDRAGVAATFTAIRDGAVTAEHTLRMRHADGSFRWFELRLRRTRRDDDIESLSVVGTLRDITERKLADDDFDIAAARLAREAVTDSLTGLANRRVLDTERERAWQQAIADRGALTMMVIDIDLFTSFNAMYGREAGDECVVAVARAINAALDRGTDLCARHRNEEFVALLPGTAVERAESVAEAIRDAISAADIAHAGSPFGRVTVSIGIASMMPTGGESADVFEQAVAALYLAKSRGRDRVELIDASGYWRK
jgi:diguanylate cyclase (GGDEF)-like protein/PAS domain S-box-containing protein